MPNDPERTRPHLRPAADLAQRVIPVTRQPQCVWHRVHRSDLPADLFGKLAHHRFSHLDCTFPLLYLGETPQTCLWEIFGDDVFQGKRVISSKKWDGYCLSQIIVPELRTCAVNLQKTRDAMSVDKASLLASDLTVPQLWGLALQRHPAGFEAIRYSSRFLDHSPCLALFDRNGLKAKLRVKLLGRLAELDVAADWMDERKATLV